MTKTVFIEVHRGFLTGWAPSHIWPQFFALVVQPSIFGGASPSTCSESRAVGSRMPLNVTCRGQMKDGLGDLDLDIRRYRLRVRGDSQCLVVDFTFVIH